MASTDSYPSALSGITEMRVVTDTDVNTGGEPSFNFLGPVAAVAGNQLFVTRFTGTFTAPLELPGGTTIQPTGKAFDVLYSTAARWKDGKIVEEYLFYDNGTFLKQIGLA